MKKKLLLVIAAVLCLAVCAVCLVTCQGKTEAATISLGQTSLSIALDGDPVTLVAALSEGEGAFTWESSDPNVVCVDENGTVTPVSKGTATITVKCGKLKAVTCQVTVGDPQHAPVFQADPMGLGIAIALDKGETYQIVDSVVYNGSAADTQVQYTTSNKSIATVSETGLVTGVDKGRCEITATTVYLGIEIEMVVTVAVQSDISFTATTPQTVSLTKRASGLCITLIAPEQQIEKKTLSVKLQQAGENIAGAEDIRWSIAEGGDAFIRLSATNGKTVTASAVAAGETTVLATTTVDGTEYTVAFAVTVKDGAFQVIHTDDGSFQGTKPCDGICDVCGKKIPITHKDRNRDCECDLCGAIIHQDKDFNGICDNDPKHDLRIWLTEENAGTPAQFAKIVAANANKYIILGENLDWSGEGTADLFGDTYSEYTDVEAIPNFSGVLDGQGYMITGFRLGHSGAGNDTAMFLKNSGTIKDIGFRFTLATANSSQTGLVWENNGTIHNVFVDVTANARSWATGPIAGITKGTIRNCITVVNEASTATGNNLAGIVGAYRGGSIRSCYSVGNGHTTTTKAFTEAFSMLSTPGFSHYANNNGLLAAMKSFSSGSGWTSSWSATEEGIFFGGKLVVKPVCDHIDDGRTPGTTPCDGICDLCGETITIVHKDENGDCVCDYCGIISHTDEDFNGICDNDPKHDLRVRLTRENAGTPALFAQTVGENAGKYLLLTTDLDWSDALFGDTYSEYTAVDAIADFSGVLDGQGHMITNFRLGHSGTANDTAMFLVNNGTIKNIGFRFTLATANSGQTGLVRENLGTIENVFVDVTANARSWATGPIAGITKGTIANCIAVINEASTGTGNNLSGLVGAYREGEIKNCYAIGNGHTTTEKAYTEAFDGLDTPDYTHFANSNALLAAVKSFAAGDGWASSWSVKAEGVFFGGELVIKPVCEHIDDGKTSGSVPCDGICDLCGETVPIVHKDGNGDCICDHCGREEHTDEDFNGICDNNPQHDLRVLLTMLNAGTPALFAQIVSENADKYLLLTTDLDWSDALFGDTYSEYTAVDAIADFSGVLDGQGHMISNFRLGHSGEANDSAMFLQSSGTIKNIGFQFTLATANSGQTGLVRENLGTIENVFVDMTANARSWATGPIAGITKGTIRNCITVVNEASTGTGNNLAGIVGAYRGGSIENCYAIGNGHTTTENAYTEAFNGLAEPVYTHFANSNALLTAVTALSAADGWAGSWSISSEEVAFGGEVVIAYVCEHKDDGAVQGTTPCDGICDLCGETIPVTHADENGDCICDWCTSILHTDADFDGFCDNNPEHDLRFRLTKENAGTPAQFAATIGENDGKYLILTEDLDWSGQTTARSIVASFSGVLDGQGHSIKGFTLGLGTVAENDYHTCLFGVNNGTIKNIAFDYTVATAAGDSMGLIAKNSGTVENLFVKVSYGARSWTTGAIVATNNAVGTVKNCITSISSTLTDQAAKNRLGAVVGVDYNGKILNCYAVNTENAVTTPYIDTWGKGVYTGSAVYADNAALLAAVTALSAVDGWSSQWAVTESGITFGGNVVIAGATVPSCVHKDEDPVDGKCDLCGEDVVLPNGTYLINSQVAATKAALVDLINSDLDGHFYLTEDLVYSANATKNIKDFTGILDGQGHTISGIVIHHGNADESHPSYLFTSNSGTIENIGFEYSITDKNSSANGLIGTNSGTVQNVYAKATVSAIKLDAWNGALVAINKGANAIIQNCIVDVTLSDSVTTLTNTYVKFGAVAGVNTGGGNVKNCYYKAIATNVTVPGVGTQWASSSNVAVLDDTVTSLPAADGWSKYWAISGGSVTFG